jgi:hypothetical protein
MTGREYPLQSLIRNAPRYRGFSVIFAGSTVTANRWGRPDARTPFSGATVNQSNASFLAI